MIYMEYTNEENEVLSIFIRSENVEVNISKDNHTISNEVMSLVKFFSPGYQAFISSWTGYDQSPVIERNIS